MHIRMPIHQPAVTLSFDVLVATVAIQVHLQRSVAVAAAAAAEAQGVLARKRRASGLDVCM